MTHLCWFGFHLELVFRKTESNRQTVQTSSGNTPWNHYKHLHRLQFKLWNTFPLNYPPKAIQTNVSNSKYKIKIDRTVGKNKKSHSLLSLPWGLALNWIFMIMTLVTILQTSWIIVCHRKSAKTTTKRPLKPYPCPGRTEDFSRLLDHNRQKEWIDVCYILPNTASLYVPKTTRKPKGLKEARKEGRGGGADGRS